MRFKKSCFGMIELLVVIGITAIILVLLLPAFFKIRTRARVSTDINNLHQIYLAMQTYASNNNNYLPYISSIADVDGEKSKTLWLLLPYVGYDTAVISPTVSDLNGRSIYEAMSSDPASTPTPGYAYDPTYTGGVHVDEPLRFDLSISDDTSIVSATDDKYTNHMPYLTISGAVYSGFGDEN